MTRHYHLRIGDLLSNKENSALGLITKITQGYFYFHLMSCNEAKNFIISEDRAKKEKVYTHIDSGKIEVHYGSHKRRRKRKIYIDITEQL
jgi:hypothetical protein